MLKRLVTLRPCLRLSLFVLLVGIAQLVLFQGPLLEFASSVSEFPAFAGLDEIVMLELLQLGLTAICLYVVAMLGELVLKLVTAALFLANAAALYYMHTYGIEFDISMIANILNTDTREASGLFHPVLLSYLIGFGAVPAIVIFWIRIGMPRWYLRPVGLGISFALLMGATFAFSSTWLWFDQHATRLGARALPWSYVINTTRLYVRTARQNRTQELLPDAEFSTDTPARKQIVVLVIGEAARADDMSAYGYARETQPQAAAHGMLAFPAGQSCATNTIGSTACILGHEGSKTPAMTGFEPLPSYMTRMGIETIFRANNSGPPPVKVDRYEHARTIAANCTGARCPDGKRDATLLWQLGDILAKSTSKRIFVTLHFTGSHGPAYWKTYPPEFEVFTPVCETVQVNQCSHETLVNAYDNSILYTDHLLGQLIDILDAVEGADSTMIYVPDHGQSLGEGGFYLHGAPLMIAPKEQRNIPFMLWMSEGFKSARGLTDALVMRSDSHPHDFPFSSVMGAFGMKSQVYQPQFDVFHPPTQASASPQPDVTQ